MRPDVLISSDHPRHPLADEVDRAVVAPMKEYYPSFVDELTLSEAATMFATDLVAVTDFPPPPPKDPSSRKRSSGRSSSLDPKRSKTASGSHPLLFFQIYSKHLLGPLLSNLDFPSLIQGSGFHHMLRYDESPCLFEPGS